MLLFVSISEWQSQTHAQSFTLIHDLQTQYKGCFETKIIRMYKKYIHFQVVFQTRLNQSIFIDFFVNLITKCTNVITQKPWSIIMRQKMVWQFCQIESLKTTYQNTKSLELKFSLSPFENIIVWKFWISIQKIFDHWKIFWGPKCQILEETLNTHIPYNSISCFNNSISCLTKEPYYHNISGQKWAIDKIPKPKIIYLEVPNSL